MVSLITHIAIDILNPEVSIIDSIKESLYSNCRLEYNNRDTRLEIYSCIDSTIYLQYREKTLLIDIIGGEEIFNKLLALLPKYKTMIRLIERGIP